MNGGDLAMDASQHLDLLILRQPCLAPMKDAIRRAFDLMTASFRSGGKLMLCGNGGSACDCEHIAGELMKGFLLRRPLNGDERAALNELGEEGAMLSEKLQRGLPTLVLSGLTGLSTAFLNDVDPDMTYAQQAFAYAKPGDVLLGITTSGNARNVRRAAIAAKARGASVIGLTGQGGGKLAAHVDILLDVSERETYRVQELHLPLYHALCAMLEAEMFGEGEGK
jgi:D-sedoheptulose 7-phosphate isomerase